MSNLDKRIVVPVSAAELEHVKKMAELDNLSITNMIRGKLRLGLNKRTVAKKKKEG